MLYYAGSPLTLALLHVQTSSFLLVPGLILCLDCSWGSLGATGHTTYIYHSLSVVSFLVWVCIYSTMLNNDEITQCTAEQCLSGT